MSKRSGKSFRNCETSRRNQPSILCRKRKAEVDLEVCSESSEQSIDVESLCSIEDPFDLPEIIPERSPFFITTTSLTGGSGDTYCLHRPSPLPMLKWAKSSEVWNSLVEKEISYTRDRNLFMWHPDLQARMRSILLDWIIEVCEVYKLHRETFYLAQDCIDRYLTVKKNLPKKQLQLLGATCLFIASKVEEIYPPKLAEFAYVTDGACTEKEIQHKELVVLMNLKWSLSPVTACSWLSVFLQISAYRDNSAKQFEVQCYSTYEFIQLCQLMDLCILDVNCLQFPYSILAASVVHYIISKEVALSVSGFKWADIVECVQWMSLFASTLRKNGPAEPKYFQDVHTWDVHNIQTHNIGLKLLENVKAQQAKSLEYSPSSDAKLGILTPPQSCKKIRFDVST